MGFLNRGMSKEEAENAMNTRAAEYFQPLVSIANHAIGLVPRMMYRLAPDLTAEDRKLLRVWCDVRTSDGELRGRMLDAVPPGYDAPMLRAGFAAPAPPEPKRVQLLEEEDIKKRFRRSPAELAPLGFPQPCMQRVEHDFGDGGVRRMPLWDPTAVNKWAEQMEAARAL